MLKMVSKFLVQGLCLSFLSEQIKMIYFIGDLPVRAKIKAFCVLSAHFIHFIIVSDLKINKN
jgi:hypothetical protein